MKRLSIIALSLFTYCQAVSADSITMSEFIRLKTGMTEAEVLYRVGLYDHETITTDYFQNIINKTWFYIPSHSEMSNAKWITEIEFDGSGRIINMDRYKP